MRWPRGPGEAEAWQRELAAARPPSWRPAPEIPLGGCFACFPRGGTGRGEAGDPGWAAAAVVHHGAVVDAARTRGAAGASYVPGLLALREGPLLEAAVRALRVAPPCLLINGTGRDHPRRAGLALALGWALDLPTAGVTDRPLLAVGPPPGATRGSWTVLRLGGEPVAASVRVADSVRPLIAHPGWGTDLGVAVALVLSATRGQRTPAPLRHARRLAREARAADGPAR